ncbi:hypothetical protein [Pseudomonas aeruginosa]|uniref:hypothetical protein n=1 Tax=Pseudomonas aeruginosa TaxID=287 RepID=UPI001CD72B07|nr:hypothetical protein [Pseudomonas aeruginosa]MCX2504402.1 hypothetical protein [Pseudomonas aeruginosa]MDF9699132.1 hypothetical protein [Pseudomonas aeruginosa]MDH5849308.1 hypothetical protein [Pseudomonas aeruginosa]WHO32194.1 hypothetical protein N1H87_24625 [Pseudomonas aeruginosa]WIO52134.1 hypothetical protein QAY87_13510 [Pseudomonas aeruginosa]
MDVKDNNTVKLDSVVNHIRSSAVVGHVRADGGRVLSAEMYAKGMDGRSQLRSPACFGGAVSSLFFQGKTGAIRFMWARCIHPEDLLAANEPLYAWRERLLDAFDGLARTAPLATFPAHGADDVQ